MDPSDPAMMYPNRNFEKYFPDIVLPDPVEEASRSSCIRVGAFMVIKKIINDYRLCEHLTGWDERGKGLLLDLAAYSIINEKNAAQYYPDYAYNHPVLTPKHKIYSDSTISRFLSEISEDDRVSFFNNWNEKRSHREKIYISYDSTNKNCKAGDIEMAEHGHPKVVTVSPIVNYAVAYDLCNQEPLLYKSRDTSEKLFCSDKTFLGNRCLRVSGNDTFERKVFVSFIALIIRCKIYTQLRKRMAEMASKPNFMTVPAALKELEKIELIRQPGGNYNLIMQSLQHRKQFLGFSA